jgi:ADP-ribosylglycohydrolase
MGAKNINNVVSPDKADRLKGCLIGGAIGDAFGSHYEGRKPAMDIEFSIMGGITDDTQLTLATCEAIIESKKVNPESVARKFLEWYNSGRLSGLGASTLQALRDLQMGAHWALSGRTGENAAGNGAAMRIAPLAFFVDPLMERMLIRDVCNITHKNDEAYVGCLAILYALAIVVNNQWNEGQSLLSLVAPVLPDTRVKDNILRLQENPGSSIREAAEVIGCSGYVAESIPFSLFAAQKIREKDFTTTLIEIVSCGGDTDTNASLAGQIMGAVIGYSGIPGDVQAVFRTIKESQQVIEISDKISNQLPRF